MGIVTTDPDNISIFTTSIFGLGPCCVWETRHKDAFPQAEQHTKE